MFTQIDGFNKLLTGFCGIVFFIVPYFYSFGIFRVESTLELVRAQEYTRDW